MPRVRLHKLFEEIRGTMYDVVLKRSPQGDMIVTKRPDMSDVEWSEAQTAQRQRFGTANEYAKAVLADPELRLLCEEIAARENRKPYRVAFSDYFKGKNLLSKREG